MEKFYADFEKVKILARKFREEIEPGLLDTDTGRYALVYEAGLEKVFDSFWEASFHARAQNKVAGEYAVQEIGAEPSSFGIKVWPKAS